MKKLLLGLLLLLATLTQAEAQCTGVFAANTICGNTQGTSGVPRGLPTSTVASGLSITAYGATCSGGTGADNASIIQTAMNDVPSGGTLRIPQCSTSGQGYLVVGSGSCIFTRTTPINIVGDGRFGSLLFTNATVPNTRDVFCMNPASTGVGWGFRDFGILSAGGSVRHAIHFNVPLGSYAFNTTIERMYITATSGGNSIRVTNDPSTTSGGVSYSQIQYNNIESIYLDTAGDGNTIQGNVISASSTNAAIRTSFVAGAGGFVINGNVITASNGHILIVNGSGVVINNNFLEAPAGVANTYGFMVDINTSAVLIYSPQLTGNQYSVGAGTSNPVAVRIRSGTTNARIMDMRYLNQSGNHIQIDSGATDTNIDRNTQFITNNIIVPPAISDAGTRTGRVQYFALGAAATPSMAFLGDPNTGIYSPGADILGFTTGGSEAARFSATQGLSVGTTTDPGPGVVIAQNGFVSNTANKTLVLKTGANGSVGTFVCTGGGTITINNTNIAITDAIIISINTVGGTISTPPATKAITGATSFQVLCGAADTSTYNYAIIKQF